MDPVQSEAERLFREVQANDDKLGRYSDHEGTDGGPTFYLWSKGYKAFKSHCQRSIRDHRAAIETMEKLQRLNEARAAHKPSQD
jgi:hypothetical protein